MGENICTLQCDLITFGYIPRGRIAGSYGHSISKFLRNFHSVLHMNIEIYILTNNVQVFALLYILTDDCYLLTV